MKLSEFDYDLPEELIAQHPIEPRDASRLLVLHKDTGLIEHKHFADVIDYFCPCDVLVLNDTKVLPARLFGSKETGALIEVMLLKQQDYQTWEVLVRPGKKARPGTKIIFSPGILEGEIMETTDVGGRMIRFSFQGNFFEILDQLGQMPLPPYIHEKIQDQNRYQTVYAKEAGSAAAPTAGLHFTHDLLGEVAQKDVKIAKVLLHVGLGTFRPVKEENIEDHKMHAEYYEICHEAAEIINRGKEKGGRIISVGTTSTRTLETAASTDGRVKTGRGYTESYIYPGYRFRTVDALITNFHLPKSSLLMLVCALGGYEQVMEAYRVAVKEKYRFFSFGDAMLII
ncbi:tRNA preQ1(34) S-adenosylmethionine ribosyltransferase-isomerase QueA [Dehalobacterium formicoaceticum]|uniref:S-adenosylmethionine:tRNA ribosyltransferase-isomerase n=1 Tax=Dehalobacterium formicoaceticum TaxID=51515 RepID=A0ABT1Y7D5_9FIRM|nr:tRNA preQ1(34) S-adenosylmethionine ribosyltransferase-isomerase QueA [Dehalobacterium formicoaceticum]MCR6546802.1 tRNA preQ1(34) S-adenosylmethionine ribosyltransferase-isomerase QueA [Dehalobacterium formicoaceticum]